MSKNINTCVILCRFRNDDGTPIPVPFPQAFYNNYFFTANVGGVGDYYRDVTNSEINVVGQTFGWFDIGHTSGEHTQAPLGGAQRDRAFQWGIAAARANGVPVDNFPHKVVFLNSGSDDGAIGSGQMLIGHWPGATFNHTYVQHEFGHVLGLGHSWSTAPDKGYDDDYCIMSAQTVGFTFQHDALGEVNKAGPGPNAVYVHQLGGIPLQNLVLVDPQKPSLLVLSPLSLPAAAPVPPAVVVKALVVHPDPPSVNEVWVELRHPSVWDRGIGAPSVVVHEKRPGDGRSFLIPGPSARALRNAGDRVVSPDGRVIVRLFEMWDNPPRALVLISKPYGFGPNQAWTHEPYYGSRGTFFADLTGEGGADAIVVNDDKIVVRLSTGNGFGPNQAWTHEPFFGTRGTFFADVTGNGRADAIVVNDDKIVVRLNTGKGFGPNQAWTHEPYFGTRGTFFADVTGNGRADAIVVNDDKIVVRLNTGNGFGPNQAWTHEPYFGTRGTFFADVTGGGRADAIVVNDGGIVVRRSTGSGFDSNEVWAPQPYFGTRGTFFADVTGDGRADAIVVNDDKVTVRRSTGFNFGPNETWSHQPYFGTRGMSFVDVSGDGRADAIVVNDDKVVVRRAF